MEGQVLDKIIGVADGRSVLGATGSFIMPNITSFVNIGLTHSQNVDIEGSKINYKPPSGTKDIIYKFFCHFCPENGSTNDSSTYEFYVGLFIDDVEITSKSASYFEYRPIRGGTLDYKAVISIGDVEDIANGKFSSWTTEKEIKLIIHCSQEAYGVLLYTTNATIVNGVHTRLTHPVLPPTIEITSVGTSSGGDVSGSGSGGSSGSSGGGSTVTKKGQVLEVLLGRAESGESVEVESGTYNFPLNTNYDNTKLNTNYQKVGSSELLNYKAPEGTERFFYEYRMRGGYDNPTGVTLIYQLYIDDIAFGNQEQVATFQQRNMVLIQSIITKSDLESKGLNINSPLDIYYKMKTNSGVYTLLEWDESATKRLDDYIKVIAIGESTITTGGGGSSGGSTVTVTKKGQTLETLVGVFDGRTVEVESGTYTLKDVTAIQNVDNVWVDLANTDIDYKPPAGTKQVYIRYTVAVDDDGMYLMRPSFRLLIDGNIYEGQAIIEQVHDTPNHDSTTKNRSFVLDINGTNDIANGFLESWNTIKKIKLQVNSPGSRVNYNRTRTVDSTKLLKPSIKIVAIGESTITTGGGDSSGGSTTTITKNGQILDRLIGHPGDTVKSATGCYTFVDNSSLSFDSYGYKVVGSGEYEIYPASSIDYKAPSGTRQISCMNEIAATNKDTDGVLFSSYI